MPIDERRRNRYRRLANRLAAALLAGLGAGCFYLVLAGGDDPGLPTMLQPDRLLEFAAASGAPAQHPPVRRLVVYPLAHSADRAQLATFDLQVPDRASTPAAIRWVRHKTWVQVPLGEGRGDTLEEYLAALEAGGLLAVDYRVAWWTRPIPTIPIAAGAAVGVCGLWLLAQFVWRGPLARMRGSDRALRITPPQLDAAPADSAGHAEAAGTGPAAEPPHVSPSPAKAALVCEPARVPAAPEEPKDYQGEYYPVARTSPHPKG